MQNDYLIKNVRLETGFEREEGNIIRTATALYCIRIENGKITEIAPNDPSAAVIDAKGELLLPAFKDMHIHLDKTLYGLPWQALSAKRKTVSDMIAYEQQIIPELLKTSVARAGQLIDLLQHYGTTFARTHFNVDPTSGLKSLEHLQQALDNKRDSFEAELVAFPQHGLFYTDSVALMRDAAQLPAVAFVGGLDPYSIDKYVKRAMDITIKLALDNNKGIDIHLHDTGEGGMQTISYLIDEVRQNPELQGRTFVSHAFALAHLSPKELQATAERMAEANIGIASSIPFRGRAMPIPTLKKHGVNVLVGNDNVQDHWSTFGSGNMLQKTNLMSELYGWVTEFDLSRALQYATQNTLPLDDNGDMQWPKVGDKAEFVLVSASCSAEAVSRIAPVTGFAHKGKLYRKD